MERLQRDEAAGERTFSSFSRVLEVVLMWFCFRLGWCAPMDRATRTYSSTSESTRTRPLLDAQTTPFTRTPGPLLSTKYLEVCSLVLSNENISHLHR